MNHLERLFAQLTGQHSSASSTLTPDHQAHLSATAPGVETHLVTFGRPQFRITLRAVAQSRQGGKTHARFRLF